MKNLLERLLLFFLIFSLLVGCSKNNTCSENDSTDRKSNIKTEQELSSNRIYSLYSVSNGNPTEFECEIFGNIIDEKYSQDITNATTTQELIDIQNKYIDLWKNEMNLAIEELKNTLNNVDFSEFCVAQTDWENQLHSGTNFDKTIIENSEYQINLGSSFKWLWLSNIREKYRDRTIHIKYLLYLIQNKGEP